MPSEIPTNQSVRQECMLSFKLFSNCTDNLKELSVIIKIKIKVLGRKIVVPQGICTSQYESLSAMYNNYT